MSEVPRCAVPVTSCSGRVRVRARPLWNTETARSRRKLRIRRPQLMRCDGTVCTTTSSSLRVQGSGFRVQGSGFRVQGSGLRVQGSGFRVG